MFAYTYTHMYKHIFIHKYLYNYEYIQGGDHVADMHKVQVMEGKCRNAATTRRVAEAARSNLLSIVT